MHHKNYGAVIDDAEDLDLVMSMYNLLEYFQLFPVPVIWIRQTVYGFIL